MYGMSGSSKGIIQSAVEFLIARTPINIVMVELYGSKCVDLLSPKDGPIEYNSTGEVIVTKAKKSAVISLNEFETLLGLALKNRATKSTNQNDTSSRTHAITIIEKDGRNSNQLVFADLAGYEYLEGKQDTQETIDINKALYDLNKVLLDKSQKMQPVYCNELTKFLRPALQQSKTTLFYHIKEKTMFKYLNMIDRLMGVRQTKRPVLVNLKNKV